MKRAFPLMVAAFALTCGCSSRQPVATVASPAAPASAPETTMCTTVVSMKSNHVVVRSGGCPATVDTAASLAHYADVEVAIHNLRPGEQATVTTAAHVGSE